MPRISRGTLLSSGLAFSTSSLLPGAPLALAPAQSAQNPEQVRSGDSTRGVGRREQLLFDCNWKFKFGNGNDPTKDLGFGYRQGDFTKTGTFKIAKMGYDDSSWWSLNLPHDRAVELPFELDGYKPLGRRYPDTSVGWYRREFEISASDAGPRSGSNSTVSFGTRWSL